MKGFLSQPRLELVLGRVPHPSVLALFILVVVCAIGVFIIRSARWRADTLYESFATEPTKPNLQVPDYASLVASTYKSTTPKTEEECKAEYEFCITGGKPVKECWSRYKVCAVSIEQPKQITSAPVQQQPEPNKNPMNVPTTTNLERMEGKDLGVKGNVITYDKFLAKYAPLGFQKPKPHEQPVSQPTPLTPSLETDRGTGAEKILRAAVLTPSMRDMIRKDVAEVVRQELEGSQYDNPYEVLYT